MNRRRPDLTEELKNKVVRDYLRGDKTILILMEYKIGPAVMYRILKEREVPLREPKKLEVNQVKTTAAPRKKLEVKHPCSELTNQGQPCKAGANFLRGGQWYCGHHERKHKEPTQRQRDLIEPSAKLSYALGLLKEDQVKAFKAGMDNLRARCSEETSSDFEIYMEVLIERNNLDNIAKMLNHWTKYLEELPDCQHTRGAILTLEALAEMSTKVYKMQPEWK